MSEVTKKKVKEWQLLKADNDNDNDKISIQSESE